ncbi:hypothetical protein [Jejuia pallidilutea]|uniref:CBM-cenC domain-containing protein n=1 Tax=Jejuia pallidilutea TaxID=504487 RepID=A0A090WD93_9FLAO|nr:hypothetical protein [Jejuia pallidilutea]GAL73404.1 hypothetical protein JCM19302_284 [Jejuia pallidilutea]
MKTKILFLVWLLLFSFSCDNDDISNEQLEEQDDEVIDNDEDDDDNNESPIQNLNIGFEEGLLHWKTYKAPSIANDAIIRVDENGNAKSGKKHLFLRLPASAKINTADYVHIGQHLELDKTKRYKYSVWLKWANPENELPNAIVSIWARNPDGTYSGKDVWIDNGKDYQLHSFEFTPTATGKVFCYISLLTHQKGFYNTDVLVDDFKVEVIGDAVVDTDPRPANINLLKNSSFSDGFDFWNSTHNNPTNVDGLNKFIVEENGNKSVQLELPGAPNSTDLNYTWTGIYQNVKLYAGNTYQLQARIDRVVPSGTDYYTILNFYAYKPPTTTPKAWLGSIDYRFNIAELHDYSEMITPTETTMYHISTRVFGWGNDGNPVTISR